MQTVSARNASVAVPVYRDCSDRESTSCSSSGQKAGSTTGQIAPPGGKREPGDSDDLATALRETSDELCLEAESFELLSELTPVHTRTTGTRGPSIACWRIRRSGGLLRLRWHRCSMCWLMIWCTPTPKSSASCVSTTGRLGDESLAALWVTTWSGERLSASWNPCCFSCRQTGGASDGVRHVMAKWGQLEVIDVNGG